MLEETHINHIKIAEKIGHELGLILEKSNF